MPNIQISGPSVGEEELRAISRPLESGWLTQGKEVERFENHFSALHNAAHGIAVTSCTTALQIVLSALGIGKGDEVIIPAFTWVSTANAIVHCGAKPVLIDVDPQTFNMHPEAVGGAITSRTKAVIPVHLFGLCSDIDSISKSLTKDIVIVEDAACAAGASYKGRFAGTLGLAGCFSFHPRKVITTGEGGMVLTNDQKLAERMRILRNHGASVSEEERHIGPNPYLLPDFDVLGFNYRMTDLQGAIGCEQTKKLNSFVDERAKWARWYRSQLADIPWLSLPQEPENGHHGWQAFVTVVDPEIAPLTRNEIMEHLKNKGVSTRPGTHSIHMLKYYQNKYGFTDDDFPNARDCANNTMALPLHNKMTQNDFEYVAESIRALNDGK